MSLKSFHIFFILCSVALAAGLGVWQFRFFQEGQGILPLVWAVSGFVCAAGLLSYLVWFVKKLKNKAS